MEELNQKILNMMKQKKMSYGRLSELTGIYKSSLHRYITGSIENIPLDKLELIAKALGTTPQHLLGWEDEMKEAAKWLDSVEQAIDVLKTQKERNQNLIYLLTLTYNLPEEYQMRILKLAATLTEAYDLERKESGIMEIDPRTGKFLD